MNSSASDCIFHVGQKKPAYDLQCKDKLSIEAKVFRKKYIKKDEEVYIVKRGRKKEIKKGLKDTINREEIGNES